MQDMTGTLRPIRRYVIEYGAPVALDIYELSQLAGEYEFDEDSGSDQLRLGISCYEIEDRIEERGMLLFNRKAFLHFIGWVEDSCKYDALELSIPKEVAVASLKKIYDDSDKDDEDHVRIKIF